MAIFRSIIFEGIRKRLGNTTSYTRCGQEVLRTCPDKIRNPRTPAQQEARRRFTTANRLAPYFQHIVSYGFPSDCLSHSRSAFIRANIQQFAVSSHIDISNDYSRLAVSEGTQEAPVMDIEVGASHLKVHIARQQISARCSRQDRLYLVLWEGGRRAARLVELGKRDIEQTLEVELKNDCDISHLYAYAFAVSANGRQASATKLLMAAGRVVGE